MWWISSIFLLVMLAAGIVVVLLPSDWFTADSSSPDQSQEQQVAPVPAAAPEVQYPDYPAVCAEQAPATGYDLNEVLRPGWITIGGMIAPTDPKVGPVLPGPPGQCFAHSPTGALYSAMYQTAERQALLDPAAQQQLVMDRMSHQGFYQEQYDQAAQKRQISNIVYQFAGYRWVSYTDDTAQLEIAIRATNGQNFGRVQAAVYHMVWDRNDWLLVPPDGKGLATYQVSNFSTFIPWGAAG